MKKTIALLLYCLSLNLCIGQQLLSTKSKKAANLYYTADNFRVRGQYNQAIALLEEALLKDKRFHEAYFRLAVIYKAKGNLDKAENYLNQVIKLNPGNNAGSYFELAELNLMRSKYPEAFKYADLFLASGSKNSKLLAHAEKIKNNAKYALANYQEQEYFDPRPLSKEVNRFPMQYFPVVSVDQQTLIFTKRMGLTFNDDEDLVISHLDENGRWKEPESLSENINSNSNEGTCTISADSRTLIFTSCNGRDGYGSCDLYVTYKTGDKWSKPENLGAAINTKAWESQPSLSADGRVLYFVSNRSGGIGKRDIWVSQKDDNDQWQKPKNAGKVINTKDDDVSPFIHPNGTTLYFGSNGRLGFGGFDIYYSERDSIWQDPQNMGSPVNTGEDQVALFITADGLRGYYSHEDKNDIRTKGRIYEILIPDNKRLQYRASYIKGTVRDKATLEPLKADIELFDLSRGKRVYKVESDSISGEYLMVLKEGGQYALYINKTGYLFENLTFNYLSQNPEPLNQDILLSKTKAGVSVVLNNIFFDVDKYDIKKSSFVELEKIVKFLKKNPEIKVEIAGHTDDTGSPSHNEVLSTKRSESVRNYLLAKGVEASKIKAKGYGSSKPLVPNSGEENRSKNRRIEFKILR